MTSDAGAAWYRGLLGRAAALGPSSGSVKERLKTRCRGYEVEGERALLVVNKPGKGLRRIDGLWELLASLMRPSVQPNRGQSPLRKPQPDAAYDARTGPGWAAGSVSVRGRAKLRFWRCGAANSLVVAAEHASGSERTVSPLAWKNGALLRRLHGTAPRCWRGAGPVTGMRFPLPSNRGRRAGRRFRSWSMTDSSVSWPCGRAGQSDRRLVRVRPRSWRDRSRRTWT